MTEVIQPIPARLKNVAVNGHVAGADDIIDDTLGKDQATINSEVTTALGTGGTVDQKIAAALEDVAFIDDSSSSSAVIPSFDPESQTVHVTAQTLSEQQKAQVRENIGLGDVDARISEAVASEASQRSSADSALQSSINAKANQATTLSGYGITDAYTKSETYTKTEVNGLITTPNQKYVTVTATAQTTAATDVLPASGEADTIYRVGNWDGTQYDTTKYAEYAFNGTNFVPLDVKEVGIDDEPTVNSNNLVKSGGLTFLGYKHNGTVNTVTGNWMGTDGTYKHYIMPIPQNLVGSKGSVTANNIGTAIIAFLSDYNVAEGESADVITQVVTNETSSFIVPTNTSYIFVHANSGYENRLPANLIIGGVDLIKSISMGVNALSGEMNQIYNNFKYVQPPYGIWNVYSLPNIDSKNNTLTFYNGATLTIGTTDYSIPADTIVSLIASGGSSYSTILFNLENRTFRAVPRATTYNPFTEILFGFVNTGSIGTKSRYYFPFNYTVDGIDVKESIKELDNTIEQFSFISPVFEWGNIIYSSTYDIFNFLDANTRIRTRRDKFYNCNVSGVEVYLSDYSYAKLGVFYQNEDGSGKGSNVWITSGKVSLQKGQKYAFSIAYSNDWTVTDVDALASLFVVKNPVTTAIENAFGTDILALNPSKELLTKLKNLKVGYVDYGVSANYPPVVSLLHFSDLHGDSVNLARIIEFVGEYSENISTVIHTGDLLGGTIGDDVPSNYPNTYLNVIGNHDATTVNGGVWQTVSAEQSYNKLIAPYVSNWGVVQPSGAGENGYYPCYYYKDYADSNLRLIVVDNMQSMSGGPDHWDATQRIWFETTLADAKENNLHVIVGIHYPPFATEHNPNISFDSISVHPDGAGWHASPDVPNAIKDFINAGGKFVCYLSGHTHCDYFGVAQETNWNNQLCIGIASASYIAGGGIYGDGSRYPGTKGQDCFNIVGIDTTSKVVKLVRIGLEYDKYMRRKNTLSWDYENSQLIYCD